MILARLFFEFFKIGLFAIGGGLATFPFLERLSAVTGWFTPRELINMIAISEATPGPLGINMATYVGYTTAGIPGAVVATLGIVTPSLAIVLAVGRLIKTFTNSRTVQAMFYGIRPAAVGLVAAAGYGVLRMTLLNIDLFSASGRIVDLFAWKHIALGIFIFGVLQNKKRKVHPVLMIAIAAVAGIVFRFGGA